MRSKTEEQSVSGDGDEMGKWELESGRPIPGQSQPSAAGQRDAYSRRGIQSLISNLQSPFLNPRSSFIRLIANNPFHPPSSAAAGLHLAHAIQVHSMIVPVFQQDTQVRQAALEPGQRLVLIGRLVVENGDPVQ